MGSGRKEPKVTQDTVAYLRAPSINIREANKHAATNFIACAWLVCMELVIVITVSKINSRDRHPLINSVLGKLGARRVEYISTVIICVIFAVSFAYLEYYYIKDPALQISNGKVESTNPDTEQSRETKPIVGNMYAYHLFPMLFIFVLISFAALFDDMSFKFFGKDTRIKAFLLGCANLTAAILVEDFAWFLLRAVAPLTQDPNGGKLMQLSDWTSKHVGAIDLGTFVIPSWYLMASAIAIGCYYLAFRNQSPIEVDDLVD